MRYSSSGVERPVKKFAYSALMPHLPDRRWPSSCFVCFLAAGRKVRLEVGRGVEGESVRRIFVLDLQRLVDEAVLPLQRAGRQIVVSEVGLFHGQRVTCHRRGREGALVTALSMPSTCRATGRGVSARGHSECWLRDLRFILRGRNLISRIRRRSECRRPERPGRADSGVASSTRPVGRRLKRTVDRRTRRDRRRVVISDEWSATGRRRKVRSRRHTRAPGYWRRRRNAMPPERFERGVTEVLGGCHLLRRRSATTVRGPDVAQR